MILTEPSTYPLRVFARELIEKNRKKRKGRSSAASPVLSQATIDAREEGWALKSDSLNARFARVLGAKES